MASQKERAERLKKEILRAWGDGVNIAAISRATGIGRNTIRALLEAEGVRGTQDDVKGEERAERRRQTIFWVRRNPGSTAAEAAEALGFPLRTVTDYLEGSPEAALLIETRAKESTFTREVMLEHLREVWAELPEAEKGNGLSKVRYAAKAGSERPSSALFEKRFPTWSAACRAAGVPAARRTRKVYVREYSQGDLEGAVAQFIRETGETSFSGYSAWAKRNPGKPSGSLVITRFGRWSNARRAVALGGRAA